MTAHYKVSCSLKTLPMIREFVRECLKGCHLGEAMMQQLVLAVDEACANNIIHQHNCNEDTGFDLFIRTKGNQLVFEIIDKGKPFLIHQYTPKELEQIIKDRKQGGLGIYLITRIMDKIEVEEKEGNAVYRFIKFLS